MWVFLNDGLIEEEKAFIYFKDLSFQRGYGAFDFFRLAGNKPLFLEDHLDRFFASAEGLRLPVPLGRAALTASIFALIEENNLPGTGIRLGLTGGQSDDGFSIGKPSLILSQHRFTPPTEAQIEQGIKLLTHSYQRSLPHIKSIDYTMAVWLQPKRIEAGADDILYHHNGIISECPRSNFFLVTAENTIVTPSENVLAGITRKKLLQIVKDHFEVEERNIGLDELKTAKEAFITSTTKQLLPVAQVDDIVFKEKSVSHQLLHLFRSIYLTE